MGVLDLVKTTHRGILAINALKVFRLFMYLELISSFKTSEKTNGHGTYSQNQDYYAVIALLTVESTVALISQVIKEPLLSLKGNNRSWSSDVYYRHYPLTKRTDGVR